MRHVLLCLALATPVPAWADDITVFAASSLKTALDAIAVDYEAASGDRVLIAYDSSAKLAKQIAAGAPADVYISAASPWMDSLQESGLIRADSRRDLLGNRLVLIGHGDAAPVTIGPALDLPGLLEGGKLAMGMVDSVPAGQYGKAALESLGLWDAVAPAVVQTDNVRAALALVALGEAPYGIVYASDAVADDGAGNQVTVVATFPADSHPPIVYPAALTATASPAAAGFLAALMTDQAAGVFAAQGFTVLPQGLDD